jgi:hypothetical protein
MPSVALPRLVVNYAASDLGEFARVAEAASALSDRYAVRLVVSHLAARNDRPRTDPGDPYLQYSSSFPDLFGFFLPKAIDRYVDGSTVEANTRLAEEKLAVLREHGILGAFLGREPVHEPESLYRRFPQWRGPRIDHPQRSRNPLFAPCLHQPEVQALYREAAQGLAERLPGIDTFYWWTNDSGSGFCWYPYLYPGENGPDACRALGPVPAMAAFHSAILDGSRLGGVTDPMSIMTSTRVWDHSRMPAGSHVYPSEAGGRKVLSIRAELSLTYPVRYLWDPLERLEQIEAIGESDPVAIIWWLSDVYHRTSADSSSTVRQIALWDVATHHRADGDRSSGGRTLLAEFAAAHFGQQASGDVVDGWMGMHEAFAIQRDNPVPRWITPYLPTYGAVSHRWLTRPMVAFPAELSPDEEADFLPYIFAIGDDARRNDLLDLHGSSAAGVADPHDIHRQHFTRIAAALERAGGSFDRASQKAVGPAQSELATTARAAMLLAGIWRSCENWIEFAVLRGQGVARPLDDGVPLTAAEQTRAEAFRGLITGVMRDELDNMLSFQALLGTDPETVVARGTVPEHEDTFTLAPNLAAQLTTRRATMLAHWQDAARLVPVASWQPPKLRVAT